MATKRRANRPRAKVPHRAWVASWGYRDNDPAATVIFPMSMSLHDVEARLNEMVEQWVEEEQEIYDDQQIDRDVEDDTAIYGPFIESYIKIVKDLDPSARKIVETDFEFYGEAFLPY